MSEFKGTKNWKLKVDFMVKENKYGANYLSIDEEDAINVIDVYADGRLEYSERINELKANALLISKAPEMLEMLERMYSHWCEVGLTETAVNNYMSETKQLIKQATEI